MSSILGSVPAPAQPSDSLLRDKDLLHYKIGNCLSSFPLWASAFSLSETCEGQNYTVTLRIFGDNRGWVPQEYEDSAAWLTNILQKFPIFFKGLSDALKNNRFNITIDITVVTSTNSFTETLLHSLSLLFPNPNITELALSLQFQEYNNPIQPLSHSVFKHEYIRVFINQLKKFKFELVDLSNHITKILFEQKMFYLKQLLSAIDPNAPLETFEFDPGFVRSSEPVIGIKYIKILFKGLKEIKNINHVVFPIYIFRSAKIENLALKEIIKYLENNYRITVLDFKEQNGDLHDHSEYMLGVDPRFIDRRSYEGAIQKDLLRRINILIKRNLVLQEFHKRCSNAEEELASASSSASSSSQSNFKTTIASFFKEYAALQKSNNAAKREAAKLYCFLLAKWLSGLFKKHPNKEIFQYIIEALEKVPKGKYFIEAQRLLIKMRFKSLEHRELDIDPKLSSPPPSSSSSSSFRSSLSLTAGLEESDDENVDIKTAEQLLFHIENFLAVTDEGKQKSESESQSESLSEEIDLVSQDIQSTLSTILVRTIINNGIGGQTIPFAIMVPIKTLINLARLIRNHVWDQNVPFLEDTHSLLTSEATPEVPCDPKDGKEAKESKESKEGSDIPLDRIVNFNPYESEGGIHKNLKNIAKDNPMFALIYSNDINGLLNRVAQEKDDEQRKTLVNTCTKQGISLLMVATYLNLFDMVKLLIELGADVNHVSNYYDDKYTNTKIALIFRVSALEIAALHWPDLEIATLLLTKGAIAHHIKTNAQVAENDVYGHFFTTLLLMTEFSVNNKILANYFEQWAKIKIDGTDIPILERLLINDDRCLLSIFHHQYTKPKSETINYNPIIDYYSMDLLIKAYKDLLESQNHKLSISFQDDYESELEGMETLGDTTYEKNLAIQTAWMNNIRENTIYKEEGEIVFDQNLVQACATIFFKNRLIRCFEKFSRDFDYEGTFTFSHSNAFPLLNEMASILRPVRINMVDFRYDHMNWQEELAQCIKNLGTVRILDIYNINIPFKEIFKLLAAIDPDPNLTLEFDCFMPEFFHEFAWTSENLRTIRRFQKLYIEFDYTPPTIKKHLPIFSELLHNNVKLTSISFLFSYSFFVVDADRSFDDKALRQQFLEMLAKNLDTLPQLEEFKIEQGSIEKVDHFSKRYDVRFFINLFKELKKHKRIRTIGLSRIIFSHFCFSPVEEVEELIKAISDLYHIKTIRWRDKPKADADRKCFSEATPIFKETDKIIKRNAIFDKLYTLILNFENNKEFNNEEKEMSEELKKARLADIQTIILEAHRLLKSFKKAFVGENPVDNQKNEDNVFFILGNFFKDYVKSSPDALASFAKVKKYRYREARVCMTVLYSFRGLPTPFYDSLCSGKPFIIVEKEDQDGDVKMLEEGSDLVASELVTEERKRKEEFSLEELSLENSKESLYGLECFFEAHQGQSTAALQSARNEMLMMHDDHVLLAKIQLQCLKTIIPKESWDAFCKIYNHIENILKKEKGLSETPMEQAISTKIVPALILLYNVLLAKATKGKEKAKTAEVAPLLIQFAKALEPPKREMAEEGNSRAPMDCSSDDTNSESRRERRGQKRPGGDINYSDSDCVAPQSKRSRQT